MKSEKQRSLEELPARQKLFVRAILKRWLSAESEQDLKLKGFLALKDHINSSRDRRKSGALLKKKALQALEFSHPRTEACIETIKDFFKTSNMIQDRLSDIAFDKLARRVVFRKYRKDTILFVQGTVGHEYYLLLDGTINLYTTENSWDEELMSTPYFRAQSEGKKGDELFAALGKCAMVLHAETCFGEASLLTGDRRYGSAVCMETVRLALVRKDLYRETFYPHHRQRFNMTDKASLLSDISLTNSWFMPRRNKVAFFMKEIKLQNKDMLACTGDPVKHVYFICSGHIIILDKVICQKAKQKVTKWTKDAISKLENAQVHEIEVCLARRGSILGDVEAVLGVRKFQYSFKAQGEAVVYQLPMQQFKNFFMDLKTEKGISTFNELKASAETHSSYYTTKAQEYAKENLLPKGDSKVSMCGFQRVVEQKDMELPTLKSSPTLPSSSLFIAPPQSNKENAAAVQSTSRKSSVKMYSFERDIEMEEREIHQEFKRINASKKVYTGLRESKVGKIKEHNPIKQLSKTQGKKPHVVRSGSISKSKSQIEQEDSCAIQQLIQNIAPTLSKPSEGSGASSMRNSAVARATASAPATQKKSATASQANSEDESPNPHISELVFHEKIESRNLLEDIQTCAFTAAKKVSERTTVLSIQQKMNVQECNGDVRPEAKALSQLEKNKSKLELQSRKVFSNPDYGNPREYVVYYSNKGKRGSLEKTDEEVTATKGSTSDISIKKGPPLSARKEFPANLPRSLFYFKKKGPARARANTSQANSSIAPSSSVGLPKAKRDIRKRAQTDQSKSGRYSVMPERFGQDPAVPFQISQRSSTKGGLPPRSRVGTSTNSRLTSRKNSLFQMPEMKFSNQEPSFSESMPTDSVKTDGTGIEVSSLDQRPQDEENGASPNEKRRRRSRRCGSIELRGTSTRSPQMARSQRGSVQKTGGRRSRNLEERETSNIRSSQAERLPQEDENSASPPAKDEGRHAKDDSGMRSRRHSIERRETSNIRPSPAERLPQEDENNASPPASHEGGHATDDSGIKSRRHSVDRRESEEFATQQNDGESPSDIGIGDIPDAIETSVDLIPPNITDSPSECAGTDQKEGGASNANTSTELPCLSPIQPRIQIFQRSPSSRKLDRPPLGRRPKTAVGSKWEVVRQNFGQSNGKGELVPLVLTARKAQVEAVGESLPSKPMKRPVLIRAQSDMSFNRSCFELDSARDVARDPNREYIPIVAAAPSRSSSPSPNPSGMRLRKSKSGTFLLEDESSFKWPGLVVESKGQTSSKLSPGKLGPQGQFSPVLIKAASDNDIVMKTRTRLGSPLSLASESSPLGSPDKQSHDITLKNGYEDAYLDEEVALIIPSRASINPRSGFLSPGSLGSPAPGSPGSPASIGSFKQVAYRSNYVASLMQKKYGVDRYDLLAERVDEKVGQFQQFEKEGQTPLFIVKIKAKGAEHKLPFYQDDKPLSKAYLFVVKLGLQSDPNYETYLSGLKHEIELQLREYLNHKKQADEEEVKQAALARKKQDKGIKDPYGGIRLARQKFSKQNSASKFGMLQLGEPNYCSKKEYASPHTAQHHSDQI